MITMTEKVKHALKGTGYLRYIDFEETDKRLYLRIHGKFIDFVKKETRSILCEKGFNEDKVHCDFFRSELAYKK